MVPLEKELFFFTGFVSNNLAILMENAAKF